MKEENKKEPESKKFDFLKLSAVKNGHLGRKSRLDWTEDSYINYSDKETSKSDKIFFGLSIDQRKINIFLLIIFVCLILVWFFSKGVAIKTTLLITPS